jgi:molybdopterin synthase catalytic subunit
MTISPTIRIQTEDFDTAHEIAVLSSGRTDIGAVVTFSGLCRGGETAALTLEHYPGMAEAEIGRHAQAAIQRWPLTGLTVIHRVGRLLPGDNIVLVVTASAHRHAAFEAADFMMDFLKAHAPFWKHEEKADGATDWVEARASDDEAAKRWDDDLPSRA